jgi:hypothetical protein
VAGWIYGGYWLVFALHEKRVNSGLARLKQEIAERENLSKD